MTEPAYKTFTCEYPFNGSKWGFEIKARSFEEAEARVKALGWATVNGELMMTIPAEVSVFGLLPRLIVWWKEIFQ